MCRKNSSIINSDISYFETFNSMHSCSQFLPFIATKCTWFVKYVYYHQLPPTCFGVCYTILRETFALFAQELYPLCNVVTKVVL